MKTVSSSVFAVLILSVGIAAAQTGSPMSNDQLMKLTSSGIVMKLGGAGEGYVGTLELMPDGSGKGSATTDAGDKIQIVGTWEIRDGEFCRVWTKLNDGKEVCEAWFLTSERSVEVFNGKNRIGANSW